MFFMSAILKEGKSSSYCLPANRTLPITKGRMKCLSDFDSQVNAILDAKASTSDEEVDETTLLIRRHPLYPVLKLFAIKCEKATVCPNFNEFDIADVMKLLRTLKSNGIDTDNKDVDNLMFSAIIELRTQLKQLEKLHSDVDACRTKLNVSVKKTQGKLAKILQNEHQEDNPPQFKVPVKRRLNSFSISALLADT